MDRDNPDDDWIEEDLNPDDVWIEEDLNPENEREVTLLQWFIWVCVCFISFGTYWCFDLPGAIFTQLRFWFGPDTYHQGKNLLLYSIYSYPNGIWAFFGGFMIDRVTGFSFGAVIFGSLVLTGQIVFALGVQTRQYWLAVMGRFVFGLGGESLTITQSLFCARWAPVGMLALWFGAVISCSRVGWSISFFVTPKLAAVGVPVSVWTGVGICLLSLIACLGAVALDYEGRDRIAVDVHANPPQLKGVWNFRPPVWVLFVTCAFFYGAVLTFYVVASDIMQNTGSMLSAQVASAFVAIPNLVSIVGCPFFGWLIDQHGKALTFLVVASLMLVITHIGYLGNALGFWLIDPVFLLIWMGIAYSLGAASMWPIVSIVVPAKLAGTAYGAMCSIQNLGLAIFPQIVAAIGDNNSGPRGCALQIVFFISVALFAAILSFGNIFLDQKYTGGKMNSIFQ